MDDAHAAEADRTELYDRYISSHFELFGCLPESKGESSVPQTCEENSELIEKLGGRDRVVQLCLPEGIGDVSWIYSKIWALSRLIEREVIVYCAGDALKRAPDFIRMLPNVHWGGYRSDRTSNQVVGQCLPPDWPATEGLNRFVKPFIQNISANFHLEMGRPLADWIPLLPVNYHYEMIYRSENVDLADRLLAGRRKEDVGVGANYAVVYTSNYQKDSLSGGWAQWKLDEWLWFCNKLAQELLCGIVVVGAEYDRDKSSDLVEKLHHQGKRVVGFINRPFDAVVRALTKAVFCVAYESGIGVLANVVNCPCLMLMSRHHGAIARSSADPAQTSLEHYHGIEQPTPEEAWGWFVRRGIEHAQRRTV